MKTSMSWLAVAAVLNILVWWIVVYNRASEKTVPAFVAALGAVLVTAFAAMVFSTGEPISERFVAAFPIRYPCAARYQRTLRRFLSCCALASNGKPPALRVISKGSSGAAPGDACEFNANYYLAPLIPRTMRLEFIRASERSVGAVEKLHNRYILTDWGGIQFGVGLDDDNGQDGYTDDLSLLSKQSFDLRWRQYARMEAFDSIPSISIQGTA